MTPEQEKTLFVRLDELVNLQRSIAEAVAGIRDALYAELDDADKKEVDNRSRERRGVPKK